ncbi:hypothetical protein [Leptospira noguchii]|uniref:Uncharacterized protein n=1 Tax=Leptospira noguchii str. 2007001578 TaxID=1049974 RepID=A0ABN0J6U6_9LEPT|nr:hypothetical protein [Leptospira noguchii]EMN02697.1 hypothetical protein LEP1GSC035_3049 [Leptospira noguchii str. 2007001578]EMS85388.1 hypothetical protein LEP1GSC074_4125 [Leptospira noguchii str. Hook]UOG48998.1 hypothetical protein MAL00_01295 [Leptospira noguchii]UOG60749.1 hypothetical protein MAL07_01255 [Leptospira noguchii]
MKQYSLQKKLGRSILLVLFIISLAVSGLYADESEKKTYSTKNIDVTVKDKDGYNHFIVFTKIMTPDKSYVAYNVEFWVNNYVYSEMDTFSQISFKAGKKSFNGNFYKSEVSSNALVLYFYMEESTVKELLTNSNSASRLNISQKNKTIFEYTIATKDNFKKALKEIITVE